ncbi:hypothetical protein LZ32DRAFT_49956 [Colletotrichum eremochloae]|nr:hypothetical protein LZ32DRAFT_49956 [Colletotrichum eremochloae]
MWLVWCGICVECGRVNVCVCVCVCGGGGMEMGELQGSPAPPMREKRRVLEGPGCGMFFESLGVGCRRLQNNISMRTDGQSCVCVHGARESSCTRVRERHFLGVWLDLSFSSIGILFLSTMLVGRDAVFYSTFAEMGREGEGGVCSEVWQTIIYPSSLLRLGRYDRHRGNMKSREKNDKAGRPAVVGINKSAGCCRRRRRRSTSAFCTTTTTTTTPHPHIRTHPLTHTPTPPQEAMHPNND